MNLGVLRINTSCHHIISQSQDSQFIRSLDSSGPQGPLPTLEWLDRPGGPKPGHNFMIRCGRVAPKRKSEESNSPWVLGKTSAVAIISSYMHLHVLVLSYVLIILLMGLLKSGVSRVS